MITDREASHLAYARALVAAATSSVSTLAAFASLDVRSAARLTLDTVREGIRVTRAARALHGAVQREQEHLSACGDAGARWGFSSAEVARHLRLVGELAQARCLDADWLLERCRYEGLAAVPDLSPERVKQSTGLGGSEDH